MEHAKLNVVSIESSKDKIQVDLHPLPDYFPGGFGTLSKTAASTSPFMKTYDVHQHPTA